MCSVNGVVNFFIDVTAFHFFPLLYFISWMEKAKSGDWEQPLPHVGYEVYPGTWPIVWLIESQFPPSPYNLDYWSTEGGYDCNGIYGENNYCFC